MNALFLILISVAQFPRPLKESLHNGPRSCYIAVVQHFQGILQRAAQRAKIQFVIRHKTIFFHLAGYLAEYRILCVEVTRILSPRNFPSVAPSAYHA
jgi:hypothetical protein